MKNLKNVFFAMLFLLPLAHVAQSNNDLIKSIQELMVKNYIFLDKAEETNLHLDKLMATKYFDAIADPKDLAKALSLELQKITKDKHLNVAPPRPPRLPRENTDFITRHLEIMDRFRSRGFGKIDVLEGNVGYVELKGFRREDIPKVDAIMSYLSTADAIIIDLRENGGGNSLGLYWSSYFLDSDVLLTSRYERRTDTKEDFNTGDVKGEKRLDMPIFILTSNFTFSAAEGFAYDLQKRNRAIIVGETTGGGAHPINVIRLPKDYALIVPISESINPITNSNWEGVGVIPNVKTTKDKALRKANDLAAVAAKTYREKPFNMLKDILSKNEVSKNEEEVVCNLLELLLKRNHLQDFMINDMGYSYLRNEQTKAASVIFKANTTIFPNSPNTHDSYAEVLAVQGKNEEALKQYKQAVLLAEKQNDRQFDIYKKNLLNFENKM